MVTYFNKKDLVAFGNFLFSEKRVLSITENNKDLPKEDLEAKIKQVYHSDIENFIESIKKKH